MSNTSKIKKQIQDFFYSSHLRLILVPTFGGGGYFTYLLMLCIFCILLFPLKLYALSGVPKLGLIHEKAI